MVKFCCAWLLVIWLLACGVGCGGAKDKGTNSDKDKPRPPQVTAR